MFALVDNEASAGGDSDLACAAGDFDVVVWGSCCIARALQPHIVAQSIEGLIVEDKLGGPALEVDSRSDAHRAANDDL